MSPGEGDHVMSVDKGTHARHGSRK
eukprot:SAG31_NODE_26269_length_445_cov_1.052023_1_plen_24_part_01